MTDSEVVAEVRSGRVDAFAELVTRYHASCRRFARHLLGDAEDAEDAVQETFVRAYRGLGRYQEKHSFQAWLFRILLNRCRSAGARRARHRERFVNDDRAVATAAAREEALGNGFSFRLSAALQGLDTPHREAFLLKIGEGLAYEEMTRVTGASIPALKMRVKRARDHVREQWERMDHDRTR